MGSMRTCLIAHRVSKALNAITTFTFLFFLLWFVLHNYPHGTVSRNCLSGLPLLSLSLTYARALNSSNLQRQENAFTERSAFPVLIEEESYFQENSVSEKIIMPPFVVLFPPKCEMKRLTLVTFTKIARDLRGGRVRNRQHHAFAGEECSRGSE